MAARPAAAAAGAVSPTPPTAASGRSPVQVVARFKPADPATFRDDLRLDLREQVVEVRSKRSGSGVADNNLEWHRFVLNNVLFNATQAYVFDVCARDIVDAALGGISGALLAYGQTGAGKTYTMVGPASNYSERGIIPRAVAYIFAAAERARQEYGEDRLTLRVSYLEVYQDRLIDLLAAAPDFGGDGSGAAAPPHAPTPGDDGASGAAATAIWASTAAAARAPAGGHVAGSFASPPPAAARPPALHIHEDAKGHVRVRGLSCPLVKTEAEAFNWLFAGEANRAIAEHALNKASTRSHCIFTVTIEQQMVLDKKTGKLTVPPPTATPRDGAASPDGAAAAGSGDDAGPTVTVLSKLHLVDLAGSERLEKSESEGVMRREAQSINKSLTFLEQVVLALTEKDRDHVPYRSSKLTHILKDSFTHGKTRLLAAVWPSPAFVDETLCTLRFAMRMMHVKTAPQREVVTSGLTDAERARLVATYERELALLRTELAFHDALAGRSGVTYGPLSDAETAVVSDTVKRYVDTGDDPTFSTLRQYHAAMSLLRRMLLHATRMARARLDGAAGAASPARRGGDAPVPPQAGTAEAGTEAEGEAEVGAEAEGKALSPRGYPSPRGDGSDGGASTAATSVPAVEVGGGGSTARDTLAAGGVAAPDSARGDGARAPAAAAAAPRSDSRRRLTEDDRASELARWHGDGGAGATLYKEYLAAKAAVREKKAAYAAAAAAVNVQKAAIDKLVAALRTADATGDSAATDAVAALAAAKAAYRAKFEELADHRAEVEYLGRVTEQLGARVASDFQRHWLALLASGATVPVAPPPPHARATALTVDTAAAGGAAADADSRVPALLAAAITSPSSRTPAERAAAAAAAADDSRAAFEAAATMSQKVAAAVKASPSHAGTPLSPSAAAAAAAAAASPGSARSPRLPPTSPTAASYQAS